MRLSGSNIAWKLCILLWFTVHFSRFLWWEIVWKLCIQIHSFGWFANWFATWFIRWIAHWFLKSNQMIHPSLISSNWAQTCECMCITCRKKHCQQNQELWKSRHCIQCFAFHCFEWCPINIYNAIRLFACVTKQRTGSDKLRESLTAACKAFSLANAKEKGTDGLVIRSLDD